MCGVIGYTGKKPCLKFIFDGLKSLEYRGYDSAGISVVADHKINTVKASGRLSNLESKIASLPQSAAVGMGHTRWATHGKPTQANAHPPQLGHISIIHN